jgi:hypothetical protein
MMVMSLRLWGKGCRRVGAAPAIRNRLKTSERRCEVGPVPVALKMNGGTHLHCFFLMLLLLFAGHALHQ